MSASAQELTPSKLFPAILLAALLISYVGPANAQQGSVSEAELIGMMTRVRAASPREGILPSALSLGQELFVEQRFREADQLFRALLEKWPREPLALYGAALAAFNLGHPDEAEPAVRVAIEIYLSDLDNHTAVETLALNQRRLHAADALVLLAVIQGARDEETEALKSVERAVKIAPEHFDAQFTLGRALYGIGNSGAATRAFRAALALKPFDARAMFFLATVLESAGETDAALVAYRDLVVHHPEAADGHLGLGVLLIKRGGGDAQKGIQELQTAVRIDPALYEAQVSLGRALLTRKLASESVEHLQRAAELAPNNPEPHYQLALAYRRLGQAAKAAEESAIVKRIHEARRGEGAKNNNLNKSNP
jgi:protein O-GlcNAc transferase